MAQFDDLGFGFGPSDRVVDSYDPPRKAATPDPVAAIPKAAHKDLSVDQLVQTSLAQAGSLGKLLEDYSAQASANTKKLDDLRQFMAYIGQQTPSSSDGTANADTIRKKVAEFKKTFGWDPMAEIGQGSMLSGKSTLSQSQMNQISEAARSRAETVSSQNETVQTRLKRVYESRNECFDFASSVTESVARSLTSIIQAIAAT